VETETDYSRYYALVDSLLLARELEPRLCSCLA